MFVQLILIIALSMFAAPATSPAQRAVSKAAATRPSPPSTKPATKPTTKPTTQPTTRRAKLSSSMNLKKFEDADHGFSFEFPYDWERRAPKKDKKPGDLDWVAYEEPRRGPDDRFRESVSVSEQRPHGEIEIAKVSKEWEDNFKEHYPDWKLVSKTEVVVDGAKGEKFVGLFHVTDAELEGELIIVKRGDHLIAVEFFTRSGLYTKYRTIFGAILNSMKIAE